jgi:RNA polymerase sigma factor (sigma-70 family)
LRGDGGAESTIALTRGTLQAATSALGPVSHVVEETSIKRLYREFASYYHEHRCCYAPANPRQIFGLCMSLYQAYRRFMPAWEFMSDVYATLGVREGEPRGLFQTFAPAKYRGKLSLERHFANLFKKKLWGKVLRSLSPKTDRGRRGDPGRFQASPELGLRKEQPRSRWDRELIENVREAMAQLEGGERTIIYLMYWRDFSARKIAALLEVDHKTVGRRYDKAMKKMREFFGVAA